MPVVPAHEELAAQLWNAAMILHARGSTESDVNCIVGLVLLKRLSDRFEEEVEELNAAGEGKAAWDDPDEHQFMIPVKARWSAIRAHTAHLGDELNRACAMIADRNPALSGWARTIDFNDRRRFPDGRILQNLVDHVSRLSLRTSSVGDLAEVARACQLFVERLAETAGKRGGIFHTPGGVAELLVQLVDPQPGMRISDPSCGAGGMLVRCGIHVAQRSRRRLGIDPIDLTLHGQECNVDTAALCQMSLVLAGLDARIEIGDTIRDPRFVRNGELMVYDRVIANPPFSLDEWGAESASQDPFGRFRYGLPPRHNGDYAFVQHALATLNSSGVAGLVVAPGVLFRGGAEGEIRARLVESDVIEAIVMLPANLLHGTPMPAAILVLNRNKPSAHRNKSLFVDASASFEIRGRRNVLRPTDIERIVAAVRDYRDEDRFCRVVALAEVAENAHNLSVARYVDTLAREAPIDVAAAHATVRELEAARDVAAAQMDNLLRLLGHDV